MTDLDCKTKNPHRLLAAAAVLSLLIPGGPTNAAPPSGIKDARQIGPVDLQGMMRDFLASDPELTGEFAIKAAGAEMSYTRTAAGAPVQLAAFPDAGQIAQTERRIKAVEAAIAVLRKAQQDHLRTADEMPADYNLRLIVPTDGTSWSAGQNRDQLIASVSAYKKTLDARYAAAQAELRVAQTNLKSSPPDFKPTAAQFEYMAHQKIRVVVKQLDDAEADLVYLYNAPNFKDEADRETIIDRKFDALSDALAVLQKQVRFEQGLDPRS